MHTKNAQNETDIYLLDSEGKQHPLIVSDGSHRRPSWSPSGKRIAFESVRGNAAEIYLINPDGTNERNTTNDPAWDERPVWSTNGLNIVFESSRANGYDLFLIDSSGVNAAPWTSDHGVNVEPCWSPDGQFLVFSSNWTGNYDLYIINLQTADQLNLTNTPAIRERAPSWSPSANKISFVSEGHLQVINSDGSGRHSIQAPQDSLDEYPPQWSPNGQSLITVSVKGQLFLVNLSTQEARSLLPLDLFAGRPPDGRVIAFEARTTSGLNIFIIYPDGSGLLQLTHDSGDDWFPQWSPRLN